jgi:hypothetical protein
VFYVYDENSIFEISVYAVAKSGCSKEALPFLKKELVRIINNKRIHREQLWRKGVVRGSRMTSLKILSLLVAPKRIQNVSYANIFYIFLLLCAAVDQILLSVYSMWNDSVNVIQISSVFCIVIPWQSRIL